MSVTRLEIAAHIDGELAPADDARVETAIASDPHLAKIADDERHLRSVLDGAFRPVVAEPVPQHLLAMIAAAAGEDTQDTASRGQPETEARVFDIGRARNRRGARVARMSSVRATAGGRWATGGLIAASLALGLFIGGRLGSGPLELRSDGALVASGSLADKLDGRLASGVGDGGFRILVNFRRSDGSYCRAYQAERTAGIACKEHNDWQLERTFAMKEDGARSEYRQAGSNLMPVMQAAQAMSSGDPLDPNQERQAQERGWQK